MLLVDQKITLQELKQMAEKMYNRFIQQKIIKIISELVAP